VTKEKKEKKIVVGKVVKREMSINCKWQRLVVHCH